jgi:primosomal protein N'
MICKKCGNETSTVICETCGINVIWYNKYGIKNIKKDIDDGNNYKIINTELNEILQNSFRMER